MRPALTDETAMSEVAWVARRARELVQATGAVPLADFVEFYERKAGLLRFLDEPDLAEFARRVGERYADLRTQMERPALHLVDDDEPSHPSSTPGCGP